MKNQSEEVSKPVFSTKNTFNPLMVLTFLALLIIFTILISQAIILLIESKFGLSIEAAFLAIKQENTRDLRDFIRSIFVVNHLFIFILPSIILALFFYKKKWTDFLQLRFKPPNLQMVNSALATFLIIAAFPLAQLALWLNQQITLPDWATKMEASTNAILQSILAVESPFELFLNIIVIAAIPAIGEELLFRGIIQRNFENLFKNPHAAVWLAAIIFSTFHIQFEGFLPRMLLGAMLGYLLYYSGNLWIPIIAHFVYNAMQVIAIYLHAKQMTSVDIEAFDNMPIGLFIISTIFVFVFGYYFIQNNAKSEKVVY